MAQIEFQIPIAAKANRRSDGFRLKEVRDDGPKDDKTFSQLIEEKDKTELSHDVTKVIERGDVDKLDLKKPINERALKASETDLAFGENKRAHREPKGFRMEHQSLVIKDLRNHMSEARLKNQVVGETNHAVQKQSAVEAPFVKVTSISNIDKKYDVDLKQISLALTHKAKMPTSFGPNESFQSKTLSNKPRKNGTEIPDRMTQVDERNRFAKLDIRNISLSHRELGMDRHVGEVDKSNLLPKNKTMPINIREMQEVSKKVEIFEPQKKDKSQPLVKILSVGQTGQVSPNAISQIPEKIGILVSQELHSLKPKTLLTSQFENVETKTVSKSVKFLTIQLKPENLGTISVRMSLVGQKFVVSIIAENHNIAGRINADVANLKLQIQAAGLIVDDISVSIKDSELGTTSKDIGDGGASKTFDREMPKQGQSTDQNPGQSKNQRAAKNESKNYDQDLQQTSNDEDVLHSARVSLDGAKYL